MHRLRLFFNISHVYWRIGNFNQFKMVDNKNLKVKIKLGIYIDMGLSR